MISKSFGLLFYLKKPKGYSTGDCPIYLRITLDGVSKEMTIKRTCAPEKWDCGKGRAITARKKRTPQPGEDNAEALNAYLDTLQAKVHEARHFLIIQGKQVTALAVRNLLQGRPEGSEKAKMLLEIFRHHNDQLKTLVPQEYALGTLTKFQTVLSHTQAFLQWKFQVNDIDVRKLNYEFVSELEFWYKSIAHIGHNTTMKYIACVRKMAIRCIRNGWLDKDPFVGFTMSQREVEREALSEEELKILSGKTFEIDRLDHVRDVFLFSCYTGLAYVDVFKLRPSGISIGIDGQKWIFTHRQKTDTASRIPLLPQALSLLDKYASNPACTLKGTLFPLISNQKINAYLKEIADCCGIEKRLTFHIARHTFATTVTLSNGVPIETVSKLLGHRNLRTTQHYAKILDKKVSQDMQVLKEKLCRSEDIVQATSKMVSRS